MFDLGFSELMVIGVVALVVLGPERLPKVARQAGQWMGKLQRYVADVKADINRQMELEELRNLQKEVKQTAQEVKNSLEGAVGDARSQFSEIEQSFKGDDSSGTSTATPGDNTAPATSLPTPVTDWDRIYATRRTRDRIRERRIEREQSLGVKRPKRRH